MAFGAVDRISRSVAIRTCVGSRLLWQTIPHRAAFNSIAPDGSSSSHVASNTFHAAAGQGCSSGDSPIAKRTALARPGMLFARAENIITGPTDISRTAVAAMASFLVLGNGLRRLPQPNGCDSTNRGLNDSNSPCQSMRTLSPCHLKRPNLSADGFQSERIVLSRLPVTHSARWAGFGRTADSMITRHSALAAN